MDKYVQPHAIWGGVVAVTIAALSIAVVIGASLQNDFDVTCIENGKSIQYTILEGSSMPQKECK